MILKRAARTFVRCALFFILILLYAVMRNFFLSRLHIICTTCLPVITPDGKPPPGCTH